MRDFGDDESGQVIEGEHLPAITPVRTPRLRLGTIRECRRELAKLYTEARRGRLPTQEATKLAYLLQTLSNMIKDDELESRISALEKAQDEKSGSKNY